MEKLKIVVVEDNKLMQSLLIGALEKWGYCVFACETAEQALDIIHTELPNMVITDWMLPGMDGPSLCSQIRKLETSHYIFTIIITGLTDVSNVISGLEAGADDFLRKPVNFQELSVRLMTGNRIIQLEAKLIEKNADLSAFSHKLNQLNTDLLVTQKKIHQEMEFAEKIQRNLLPKNDIQLNNVIFQHLYCHSLYISGDMLNYFEVNQEIVCFYAVDVCGHGIGSAMLSYSISKIISQSVDFNLRTRDWSKNIDIFENPHIFVDYLNNTFYKADDCSLYFSMIFGFINTQTRNLSFCQAGHPPPIFQRRDSSPELLGHGGFPVALLAASDYDSITLHFQHGDRLYVYSDGVSDCNNCSGQIFDTERLIALLEESQSSTLDLVFADLKCKLVDWHGSEKFDDDISILGIEFV